MTINNNIIRYNTIIPKLMYINIMHTYYEKI